MGNPDLLLSRRLCLDFCTLCNLAFYSYQLHRSLFDQSAKKHLRGSAAGAGLGRLSQLCQKVVLLEIAKLHDPAAKGGRDVSLSIDFVVRFGGWTAATRTKLEQLAEELESFYEARSQGQRGKKSVGIRAARNRAICHNDLEAMARGEALGGFTDAEGARYFDNLQELVNLIWQEAAGCDHPFDRLGEQEGAAILRAVMSGDTKERESPGIPR